MTAHWRIAFKNTAQRLQDFLKVMHGLNYCPLRSTCLVSLHDRAIHLELLIWIYCSLTLRVAYSLSCNLSIGCFSAAGFPLLKLSEEHTFKVTDARMILWHTPAPYIVLPDGKMRYCKRNGMSEYDVRELLNAYENTM